jgi:hypothetical protein
LAAAGLIGWARPAVADGLVPDASFRACINTALRQAVTAEPTVEQMAALTGTLACDGRERNTKIESIAGAQYLKGVTGLVLSYNQIADISDLGGLTQLTELDLIGNKVTSTTALAPLTGLRSLDLRANQVTDLGGLSKMTDLVELYADGNQITSVTPLAGLTNLTKLWLGNNAIADISALRDLTAVTELSLENNAVADVTALSGMTALRTLYLQGNGITDLTPLPSALAPVTCSGTVCTPHVFAQNQDAAVTVDIGINPIYVATAPGASGGISVVVESGTANIDMASGTVVYPNAGEAVLTWTSGDNKFFTGRLTVTVREAATAAPSATPEAPTPTPSESAGETASASPTGTGAATTPGEQLPTTGAHATLDQLLAALALTVMGLGALTLRLVILLPLSGRREVRHAA